MELKVQMESFQCNALFSVIIVNYVSSPPQHEVLDM